MTGEFRPATDDDIPAVLDLWQRAGMTRPWNPPEADIAAIRANPKSALLVAMRDGRAAASVAVEDGGHRAWVYYLCADPELRGQGWGRRAMAAAEEWALRRFPHNGCSPCASEGCPDRFWDRGSRWRDRTGWDRAKRPNRPWPARPHPARRSWSDRPAPGRRAASRHAGCCGPDSCARHPSLRGRASPDPRSRTRLARS